MAFWGLFGKKSSGWGLFDKKSSGPEWTATQTLRSSNIRMIEYDHKTNTLYVTFQQGGYYKYDNVPVEIFEEMGKAESVGKYFWEHIRDNPEYPYHRIHR